MTGSLRAAAGERSVDYGDSTLLPQHAALLGASAIAPQVARERGYRSVTKAAELEQLGFGRAQRRVPSLLIPVHDVRGEVQLHQLRPDEPRRNKTGKPVKYETPTGASMTLDVPPSVRAQLGDPLCPLFITEGARKADAAASIGLACIALLGVWNWRGTNGHGGKLALADFELVALNDRHVYLVFDSDVVVKADVHSALERLKAFLEGRGADVRVVYLPNAQNAVKAGLDDFLAAGNGVDELLALASPELRPGPGSSEERRTSPTAMLVSIATEAGAELFHTPDGKAYATVPVDDHKETWPLKPRSGFEHWLRRTFRARTHDAVSAQAVDDALRELDAQATCEGPVLDVACRIAAQGDDTIYLDLVNDRWEAVEITASGWRIVAHPPVKFRRRAAMLELPHPVPGGRVDELRDFLNVASDQEWTLLIGWLLGTFSPRGPYPVLTLHGEQGSAKSTTARLLRSLVDPNASPLRGEPRGAHDLMIAATNAWCLAFDNLSHVHPWLSDALCRLSTGGGFSTRALYTDDDEIVFEAQRPLLLTGIEEVVTRSDLLSRAILVELAPISGDRMRDEATLQKDFAAAQPRILGALLDSICGALARRPHVTLDRLPRMADFALWVTAAEESLGWSHGSFLAAYDDNRDTANDVALEASPIGSALRDLLGDGEFTGSSTELLAELAQRAGETVTRRRGWPANPRALSGEIKRLAPNLRSAGFGVELGGSEGRGNNKRRVIRLLPPGSASTQPAVPAETVPTVPTDPIDDERLFGEDPLSREGVANGVANGDAPLPLPQSLGDGGDGGDGSADLTPVPCTDEELAEIERLERKYADLFGDPS